MIKSIKESLETLPRGSEPKVYATMGTEATERIVNQPRNDAHLAKEALAWIVRAQRPLQAIELQHALATEAAAALSSLDEDNAPPIDEVISLCAGLVTEGESSGTMRLVHYTAQKFFVEGWATWFPGSDPTLARKCAKYLTFEEKTMPPYATDPKLPWATAQRPRLAYTRNRWPYHVRVSDQSPEQLVDD